MAKEKVTLTLETSQLQELRRIAGARSLSASVDEAVRSHLKALRHQAAVAEWLAEQEEIHGPIPEDVSQWANQVIDEWEAGMANGPKRHGPDADAAA